MLGWLREQLRADFRWPYYLFIGVFLGLSLWLNYTWFPERSIEAWFSVKYYGKPEGFLFFLLFYSIPFVVSMGAYIFFHKEQALLRKRDFWIRVLAGLLILTFDSGFYFHRALQGLATQPAEAYFLRKLLSNLGSVGGILLPLLLFRWWYDKEQESLYGLTFRNFHIKPYLVLLLLMVPLVLAASFESGFINYYPTLRPGQVARLEHIPAWAAYLLYNTVYASDFVWEELIFRGFLIIGMAGVLGRGAVLPMSVIYCFRHFAKPPGEAISS
ncbi:MAG: hypothetical protein EAZ89_02730, partial [Bacteroidetes bacterium]